MVAALSLEGNGVFVHLSFITQTRSSLAEQVYLGVWMDQDPAALASRIITWWDSFSLPLHFSNEIREYFEGLSWGWE